MGLLNTLMEKVFGNHQASSLNNSSPQTASTVASSTAQNSNSSPDVRTPAVSPDSSVSNTSSQNQQVDIENILNTMNDKNKERLNWKSSIVDLMKLVGLDSSLSARKQLSEELHYSGDTNDSASMNIWLHSQVMKKFAENGGKMPTDLQHKV
jgi:Domain of unknown function (DUF3597)